MGRKSIISVAVIISVLVVLIATAIDKTTKYVKMIEIEVENEATGVRKAVGTGVVYQVDEAGVWIATAAHILHNKSDEDRIMLKFADASAECKSWMEVEGADLAFLYLLQEEMASEIIMVPIETDKMIYDGLTVGENISASGYWEGKQVDYQGVLTENWIYVEDFAQYMMVAECEVKQGMSGGGLYDASGNYIGMICGGNEEGELVAMPWHVMQARFEETCDIGCNML